MNSEWGGCQREGVERRGGCVQPPLAGRDRSHFLAPGPQTSYTRHRERFFPMMMNDQIEAVIGKALVLDCVAMLQYT